MKYFIPIAACMLAIACHEQHVPEAQATSITQDSTNTTTHISYITAASAEVATHLLSFKSSYQLPDGPLTGDTSSYFDRNWLFLENTNTHKTDSLELTDVSDFVPGQIQIKDVTEEYHFTSPLIQLTYMVENDALHHTFFSYANDSLQLLFMTDGMILSIQKQGKSINGITSTRVDNLPYDNKYPFTVSLSDHQFNVIKPDTEILGYDSKARMDITTFRLKGNKPIPYIIKESTDFRLDTFYRPANLLRMTIADSIPVYGKPEEVLGLLEGNDAG